ncbi:hypothetical protein I5R65_21720 [Herbaspirillum sp. AP02]|uniref:hypothetical protein n=1 Tax=unclassified Herbaspirillum TaxID=2624150 RepID=UPI0015D9BC56|nr:MULTISPECIES: hypothetical protein [unclassified Herbaspirillum]MBG7622100.1 hypothetical protein [Herbaspirillum sp. AP02]NZD69119.1 hypothetical protein [Herbaspirillum sp. AP21]
MDIFDAIYEQSRGDFPLQESEKEAARSFSIYWGFFEGQVCGSSASPARMMVVAQYVIENDEYKPDLTKNTLAYFKHRYTGGEQQDAEFRDLRFRNRERRYEELVHQVLRDDEASDELQLAACLLVILRYRNNLFHGMKWTKNLQGQEQNFVKSLDLMMYILPIAKWKQWEVNGQ